VQADHLPADESVVDAHIVRHRREIAHRKEAGLIGLR
jgi:hypothetical protein